MSVICLQYGQCGNQIGSQLFSQIYENTISTTKTDTYSRDVRKQWFHMTKKGKFEPRSILIDTESKVVFNNKLPFTSKSLIVKSLGGSANNWAFGYNVRSMLFIKDILEAVRKELEKNDKNGSLLNIFSTAGGTGSGIGSKAIEALNEEYPEQKMINVCVLPYMNGEIVTQSYNTLLTLSKMYRPSDCTLIFENDRLHHLCANYLNVMEPNFENLNKIVVRQLIGLYNPLKNVRLDDLIDNLINPQHKFLQLKCDPLSLKENSKFGKIDDTWKNSINTLSKQFRFDSTVKTSLNLRPKAIGLTLISRGREALNDADVRLVKDTKLGIFTKLPDEFKLYQQSKSLNDVGHCLTCVTNSNLIAKPLDAVLADAWNLFTNGAYLHHYKKYQVDEEFFLEQFSNLEQILKDYKQL